MTFGRTLIAVIIGTMLTAGIMILILFGFFGAALAGSGPAALQNGSVLRLNLNYAIPEKGHGGLPEVINPLALNFSSQPGLDALRAAIREAAKDDKIDGILLDMGVNPNGLATMTTVRGLLKEFRASGKFVWAYGQYGGQRAYYLACAADSIYLHPTGGIELKGYNAELTFFKNGLDKLGVEVQVFYDGKYKSATEPFRYEKMSDANRLQVQEFIDEVWSQYLNTVASDRRLDPLGLQTVADRLDALQPKLALQHGLVDALLYEDELYERLRRKTGLDADEDVKFVKLKDYLELRGLPAESKTRKSGNIAVIYAQGSIVDGQAGEGSIGGHTLAKLLREARRDEDVDAVVLRVNSPGGSAPASDVIWREAQRVAEEKTLIVSMGDLAASGGYYIAAPADKILAEAGTLTGSIGVFFILPNMRGLLEDKMGITSDTVKTGAMADFPTINRPVSDGQRAVLQALVDSTYVDFKRRVSTGRGMSMDDVEAVAQGRIWTGTQALENGLVDELGGLDEAIASAAEMARLGDDYGILHWPEVELDPLEQLLMGMSEESRAAWLQTPVTALPGAPVMEQVMTGPWRDWLVLAQQPSMQARMPFALTW